MHMKTRKTNFKSKNGGSKMKKGIKILLAVLVGVMFMANIAIAGPVDDLGNAIIGDALHSEIR